MIYAANDANFAETVQSDLPVLIDFHATWCGPCRALSPIIDEIATELAGHVKVVKVDVGQAPETAARFGILSVPTIVIGKNVDGEFQFVKSRVGFANRADLGEWLEGVLA